MHQMGHMHGNVSDSMLISWENPVPEGVEKMHDIPIFPLIWLVHASAYRRLWEAIHNFG